MLGCLFLLTTPWAIGVSNVWTKDRCLPSLQWPVRILTVNHSCCLSWPSNHLVLNGSKPVIVSLASLEMLQSSQFFLNAACTHSSKAWYLAIYWLQFLFPQPGTVSWQLANLSRASPHSWTSGDLVLGQNTTWGCLTIRADTFVLQVHLFLMLLYYFKMGEHFRLKNRASYFSYCPFWWNSKLMPFLVNL